MNKLLTFIKENKVALAIALFVLAIIVAIVVTELQNRKSPEAKLPNYSVNTLKINKIENAAPTGELKIESINPQATVELEFNVPIDISGLQVTTVPQVEVRGKLESKTKLLLIPATSWDYSKRYELTLSGIKPEGGVPASTPFVFIVKFAYPSQETTKGL